MSIESRYVHTLVVKRLVGTTVPVHEPPHADDGDPIYDDYGQPVTAEETLATVPGLVQPRKGREVAYVTQGGPVVADYYGYCAPLAGLDASCWLEVAGVRYDVLHVADAAGLGHHLELDLRRVE